MQIQARSKPHVESAYEHVMVSSDDEEYTTQSRVKTSSSESGDDSDVEFDDDEDESLDTEIATTSNKFALLDEEI